MMNTMAQLPNPHDSLFRSLLTDPERAGAFLRQQLPKDIAVFLDDTPPEVMDGSFVDEDLAGSQSDLLLKVKLVSGRAAYCYVLAEHKSTPDPEVLLQLASYMVRIWKRIAGSDRASLRTLPPIIPVVVYHGEADWNVPRSLTEVIAAEDPALVFLPGSGYILRNLREMGMADLPGNPGLRAGFMALMQEPLPHVIELIQRLAMTEDLSHQILEYVIRIYAVDIDQVRATLRQTGNTELEALMDTIADNLLKQGRAEGEAHGKMVGFAEGKAEGKVETFLRLARRKFGEVPPRKVASVKAASARQLDRWLEDLITAERLDDVLGDTPPH